MTFIEILVVLVILGVLTAAVFPSLKSMNEKNRIRAAARDITSLMKFARAEAVYGERTTEVFLDTDKREYWLDLREPDPKTKKYNPKAKKRQVEQKRQLEKDIWFEETSTYDQNVLKGKIIAFDFYPDGSASPGMLTLASQKGSRITLEVLKSSGKIETFAGSIEDLKAQRQEEMKQAPTGAGGGSS